MEAYSVCNTNISANIINGSWREQRVFGNDAYRGILDALGLSTLEGDTMTLVLKTLGGNETLDLGCFLIGFLVAFGLDFAADDIFTELLVPGISVLSFDPEMKSCVRCWKETYIIILGQSKEPPDLGRSLGSQSLGLDPIRQARNLPFPFLHNRQCQHAEVHGHDAPTHALPLPFSRTSWAVAAVAFGKE